MLLVIILGVTLYLTTKKPVMLPMISAPEQALERKPAIASIIADYDAMYDSNEYCFDGEVYELRCEETCRRGGTVVQPKIAFLDCKQPKHCCQYAPAEWSSFDEEPPG